MRLIIAICFLLNLLQITTTSFNNRTLITDNSDYTKINLDNTNSISINEFQAAPTKTYTIEIEQNSWNVLIEVKFSAMSFNGVSLKPILAANKNSVATMSYSTSSTASLVADKTDKNAYIQNKNFHYIQLISYSDILTFGEIWYISLFDESQLSNLLSSNIEYNYEITFTKSIGTIQCPQSCSSRGLCTSGSCYCYQNYIDEDCSKYATPLSIGIQSYDIIPGYDSSYYFFDLNDFNNELQLLVKKDDEFSGALKVVIGVTSTTSNVLPYPNEQQYDYVYDVPATKSFQLYSIPAQYLSKYKGQKNTKFITAVFNQQKYAGLVYIKFTKVGDSDEDEGASNSSLIIVYVLVAVAFVLLSFWAVVTYCRYKTRHQRIGAQNLVPRQDTQKKLTPAIIEKFMPVVKFQNRKFQSDPSQKNQKENCAVCLVDFTPEDNCRETICWHVFHQDCLDQWLKKHENCPYCREGMTVKDLEQNHKKPKQRKVVKVEKQKIEPQQSLKEQQSKSNTIQTNEIELDQPYFQQKNLKPQRQRSQKSRQQQQQQQEQLLSQNQQLSSRPNQKDEEIEEINLDNFDSETRFISARNGQQNYQPIQFQSPSRQLINENPNYRKNLTQRQQQINSQRLLLQMKSQQPEQEQD